MSKLTRSQTKIFYDLKALKNKANSQQKFCIVIKYESNLMLIERIRFEDKVWECDS